MLADAKAREDISVEDLNEIFYISYEMAAHRLTNLITRHFDIPVHFQRSDPEGLLWKAYENDGVLLPGRRRRHHRGPAAVPVVELPPGLRVRGLLLAALPVHRDGRRARSGAPPTSASSTTAGMPSPSGPGERRPTGSAAATPSAAPSRAAPTRRAAGARLMTPWPAGKGWPGRRRGTTATSCRACRPTRSVQPTPWRGPDRRVLLPRPPRRRPRRSITLAEKAQFRT